MRSSRSARPAPAHELLANSRVPIVVKDAVVLVALAAAFAAGLILIVAGLL